MSALRAKALSAAFIGQTWLGLMPSGSAWLSWTRNGEQGFAMARADDLSAEGFGPLRWVLWNPDVAELGRAGRGQVGHGVAWCGTAGQGLQTAVRRVHPPYCSLGNRSGLVVQGESC